jgi:pimeloyl-ACP methyl ester carboxylesterase
MVFPERFSKLIIMNTILATGSFEISQGFIAFRDWVNQTPDMNVGRLMKRGTPILTNREIAAYDAPFPDVNYKAGVRMFPNLVPTEFNAPGADISRKAREWFKSNWKGQVFMAVGKNDPVLGPSMMDILRSFIPRCSEPLIIEEAGHFLQEWGEIVAKKALEYFKI